MNVRLYNEFLTKTSVLPPKYYRAAVWHAATAFLVNECISPDFSVHYISCKQNLPVEFSISKHYFSHHTYDYTKITPDR